MPRASGIGTMRKLLRTTLNTSSSKVRLQTLYVGTAEIAFALLRKPYVPACPTTSQRKGCSIPITKKWKTRFFS